jgi:hypothetical protein
MNDSVSNNKQLKAIKWIIAAYFECAKEAALKLYRNWIIIPASMAALVVFYILLTIVGQTGTGFAGGLLAGLAQIALLTLYYYWINETLNSTRLSTNDLYHFDYSLFSSIINVGFVIFIAQFLLGISLQGTTNFPVLALFSLIVSIVFNPVAEIIIQHRSEGIATLSEAYHFVQENWIEWFVPFILMLLPWIMINPSGPLAALSQTDPLLPASPLIYGAGQLASYSGINQIIGIILGTIIANWFMIFRSLLFKKLSTSSRRKRAYL